MTEPINTASAQPFANRELSWMDFNSRVLEEATKKDSPVLERMKFLSITASNLDEFFMVRVAGLQEQVLSKYKVRDISGMLPTEQLSALSRKIHDFCERQYACYHRSILPELRRNGLEILKPEDLSARQINFLEQYFDKVLFPVLTPLAVDRSRPFPLLANKSLNIAVRLRGEADEEPSFAVVQVPSILSRFLELPSENGDARAFILLESVILLQMHKLFELRPIQAMSPFRVTRDSDLAIDEETEDLLSEIQKSIRERKRGRPARLELLQNCDRETKEFLTEMLDVPICDIYEVPGPLDLTFCMKFSMLPGGDKLRIPALTPITPADFYGCSDLFGWIRQKDRMVHHPYESFDCVIDFVRQAASDPEVLAIKQTLYRVSGNSPIIAALIRAAENGKQVTVLVELKARFDEENNIHWAKKLEEAGCHVIYGLSGLKIHCKILLIVRREDDGIRRYVHMSTGNYNDSTARLYTDIGLFTCNDYFGEDASSLFNVLTGYSRPPEYNKMIVAPDGMKKAFCRLIDTEIENARKGLPCGITVKVNSLSEPVIISRLYAASQAGVPIRLIVRGICCLKAGVPGLSENISVVSIVGQLLEHSRIFKFENGGSPKVYLGSADWMSRNLDRRVELVFPVEDPDLRQRLFDALDLMLSDNTNARVQFPDSSYAPVVRRGRKAVNSQAEFYRRAKARLNRLEKEHGELSAETISIPE